MAEMTAVEFLKEYDRMCDIQVTCKKCPFSMERVTCSCDHFIKKNPEKAVDIVQKWAEEHPVKTMLQDLLEKYPNVILDDRGVPKFNCPYYLGYEKKNSCPNNDTDCVKCWNRPLEE